jgi:hypothetical protein
LYWIRTGEGANGATGKTLLTQAFEKVRPTTTEDGKFFKTKDRFALSQVSYNSRVLVMDDSLMDIYIIKSKAYFFYNFQIIGRTKPNSGILS